MSNQSRRNFIRNSSALLTFAYVKKMGFNHAPSLNKKRVALIGTGWYGKNDLFRLMQVAPVDIVGLSDPDARQLSNAEKLIQERNRTTASIPSYSDYRKMLKEQTPELVVIGSPDHWHALMAIDAMKSGAHIYLQKPISVDVLEGEAIVAAAKKYNKVVQVGTQRRSTPHLIEAKQLFIDSGRIGKVHHVEMCCYYHMRDNRNPPIQSVPDFFDYDRWTGPAPLRPYDGLPHRSWWRAFMEYGNGIMGDMCIHMFDTVRWMLQLGWPLRISSTGGIFASPATSKSTIADTQTAIFEYEGLNCIWQHRTWGTPVDPQYPWSFKIYGEKGTLCGSTMQYDFIPVGKDEKIHRDVYYEREQFPEDLKEKDIELFAAPATRNHMKDFLSAIDSGTKPVAAVEEGHISTASCIIANLSMQLGRPLVYDPAKRIIVNDAEATALLKRNYREGFQHPSLLY